MTPQLAGAVGLTDSRFPCVDATVTESAVLALSDGTIFRGRSIGANGKSAGEVVFNTAITGYQEILTDPSYAQQIVTLTYSHIGNTGVNPLDVERDVAHAAGLVIRDSSSVTSNWRAASSLEDYLRENNIVGISDIDTRKLTRILRDKGAQNGCIVAGPSIDTNDAIAQAREFPGLKGLDLAKEVTTQAPFKWNESTWRIATNDYAPAPTSEFKVVAYDFGVKHNILRLLSARGCDIEVVPAQTPADEVLKSSPDGVFLSNGPGDPEPCDYAVEAIATIVEQGVPTFGICLGHQLLGLACGAQTTKMKFGHHGANHPVKDLNSGRVFITSQNHGFAIDEASLPAQLEPTHRSLFDGSLQGIRHTEKPAFGFQGHPEASPGPHDIRPLFDNFIELMREKQNRHG